MGNKTLEEHGKGKSGILSEEFSEEQYPWTTEIKLLLDCTEITFCNIYEPLVKSYKRLQPVSAVLPALSWFLV